VGDGVRVAVRRDADQYVGLADAGDFIEHCLFENAQAITSDPVL
jgi:hypothetical protein